LATGRGGSSKESVNKLEGEAMKPRTTDSRDTQPRAGQASQLAGATPSRPTSCGEAFDGSFAECKEQQLVFLLVRQLAAAQFELANPQMTERLWQEVAALDIDPERITALLYGGQSVNDRAELRAIDEQWRARHRPQRRGWFSRPTPPVGGRRSAARGALRVHQPAR
jgi:hypothetical protein